MQRGSAKRRTLERYLAALERVGDRSALVACLRRLGEVAEEERAPDDALAYYLRALIELPATTPRAYRGEGHLLVGRTASRVASREVAQAHLGEALAIFRAEGRPGEQALCLESLAKLRLPHDDAGPLLEWAPYPVRVSYPDGDRPAFAAAGRLFADAATAYLDAGMASAGLVAFNDAARCHLAAAEDQAARLCLMAALQLSELIDEDASASPLLDSASMLIALNEIDAAEQLVAPLRGKRSGLTSRDAGRVAEITASIALRRNASPDVIREQLRQVQRAVSQCFENRDEAAMLRLTVLSVALALHLDQLDLAESLLKRVLAVRGSVVGTARRAFVANLEPLLEADAGFRSAVTLRAQLDELRNS